MNPAIDRDAGFSPMVATIVRALLVSGPGSTMAMALGIGAFGVGWMPPAPEYAPAFVALGFLLFAAWPLFFSGSVILGILMSDTATSRVKAACVVATLGVLFGMSIVIPIALLAAGMVPKDGLALLVAHGVALSACTGLHAISFTPVAVRVPLFLVPIAGALVYRQELLSLLP